MSDDLADEGPAPEPWRRPFGIWREYHRVQPYRDGETVAQSVVSIDVGILNLAIARCTRLRPSNRRILEHLIIVNLRDDDGTQDVHTLCRNLRKVVLSDACQWIWEPATLLLCETQLDQRSEANQPLNFGVYCMFMMLALDHSTPMLLLNNRGWEFLAEHGINAGTALELQQPEIRWMGRSGKQKTGLEQYHGDARKDMTLIMGPKILRQNGDTYGAAFLESLRPRGKRGDVLQGKRKPMEDGCDAVLQADRKLLEDLELEQKEERKAGRAENAQRKREEKAARAEAREAKRKRDEGKEKKARPRKRLRRADGASVGAGNVTVDLTGPTHGEEDDD